MRTRNVMILSALALFLCAVAPVSAVGQEAETEPPRAGPPEVVVEVGGLTCPFCAYGLEKKFVEAAPVDSVEVGLETGEVRLWLKPEREMTDAEVRDVVRDAGFTPGEVRRPASPPSDRSPPGGAPST